MPATTDFFMSSDVEGSVAFREVCVNGVREVLRAWLAGAGLRTATTERAGVDRKTARRYVEAGEVAGLVRDGGEGQLTDELIGAGMAGFIDRQPLP